MLMRTPSTSNRLVHPSSNPFFHERTVFALTPSFLSSAY